MTLGLRKVLIVGLVAGIVLIANLLVMASWLDQVDENWMRWNPVWMPAARQETAMVFSPGRARPR